MSLLTRRTLSLIRFDLMKLAARLRRLGSRNLTPDKPLLHFGSGSRRIAGWLNVDLVQSDFNLDLTGGRLPWKDSSFNAALSQHVIEHLELRSELVPLLKEVQRVLVPGGEIWLSCPDIEKLCRSYLDHRMEDLVRDRVERSKLFWDKPWTLDGETGLKGVPSSQMINSVFYQGAEHRNLFDLDLLRWTLELCGFSDVEQVDEAALRSRFPEVPLRGDDAQALYVRAVKPLTA